MAYDPNIDYQAAIEAAKAKGDYLAAAKAEAARKEKIDAMNAAGTNTKGYTATNDYAGNLDTRDYSTEIKQAIASGADPEAVLALAQARAAKANSAVNLKPFADDDIQQAAYAYAQQQNQAPSTVQGVQQLKPELSGIALGDKYGLTYDMGQIKGILDKATQGIYDNKNEAFKTTENNFYNQMGGLQAESIDALKKTQAAAVATGASKGMAAASELSAILGLQEQTAPLSNDLANQRNLLASEEAAAYDKNASAALDTSNSIKQAIANLDMTKYGYDIQESIGIMDYLAALQDIAATKDASAKTLEGVKYNADSNLAGTKYNSSGYNKNSSGSGSGSGLGAGSGEDKTPTEGNLKELDDAITANGGYTPEGHTETYIKSGDGYIVKNYTKPDGTVGDLTISAAEMEKIKNNGWDPNAAYDLHYGAGTTDSTYDLGDVAHTKSWTEQQAIDYMNKTGKEPPGWVSGFPYGPGHPTYAQEATYVGQKTTNTYTITGAQGQKISTGVGSGSSTWTYNSSSGTWSNTTGSKLNMADFKAYLAKQNQAYVKALN